METTLLKLGIGKKAKITGIKSGYGFRRKLACLNARVGKTLKKIATHPLMGPVVIEIEGREIALGRGMASKIMVDGI